MYSSLSEGVPFDTQPALWVLPFNATTGAYGAPILIDNTCGIVTEVLVATTAATPVGAAAPAWNVGDVLVLSNDIFNARVMVYSQAAIQSVLANPGKPLNSPTSIAVGPSLLRGTLPIGMDIWPADATHGVSLLLTTFGGRVMRFDSAQRRDGRGFRQRLGIRIGANQSGHVLNPDLRIRVAIHAGARPDPAIRRPTGERRESAAGLIEHGQQRSAGSRDQQFRLGARDCLRRAQHLCAFGSAVDHATIGHRRQQPSAHARLCSKRAAS